MKEAKEILEHLKIQSLQQSLLSFQISMQAIVTMFNTND